MASINVECTDPSQIGNAECGLLAEDKCSSSGACCIEVTKTEFKEAKGFTPVPPPPIEVPPFP